LNGIHTRFDTNTSELCPLIYVISRVVNNITTQEAPFEEYSQYFKLNTSTGVFDFFNIEKVMKYNIYL